MATELAGLNLFNLILAVIAGIILACGFGVIGKVKKKDTWKAVGAVVLGVVFIFGFWMNAIPNLLADFSLPSGGAPYTPPASIPSVVTGACGDDNLATIYSRAENVGASILF